MKQGNRALAQGEVAEAERCYRMAVAASAADPDAHLNLGYALLQQDRTDAARASLLDSVRLRPLQHDGHFLLARLAVACGQPAAALDSYWRALAAQPDSVPANLGRADLLVAMERFADAAAHFDAVLEKEPEEPAALIGRANCLLAQQRLPQALAAYDAVLALHPGHALAWLNRGNTLLSLRRDDEALQSFQAASAAKPGYLEAQVNIGSILHRRNRVEEAMAAYRQALAQDPSCAAARWNLGLCLLLQGELQEGWALNESRWQALGREPPRGARQWSGEDLRGRSILLHSEQGLGDTLQFFRYAPLVADRGGRVFVHVQAALRPLLAGLDPRCTVVDDVAEVPRTDFLCPLMSLPFVFGTRLETIPAAESYVHSDPALVAAWRKRLGPAGGLRVGIAWSGNPGHVNDSNRSLACATLAPPLARSGATHLVSLQKDLRAGDAAAMSAAHVVHFGELLTDFRQTAALVECMDLVVAVDTSVAHLAAAMGKPTWILLPFCPDWRWLLERADSPWYPSVRLFRQERHGDWSRVLAEVQAALAERAADGHSGAWRALDERPAV